MEPVSVSLEKELSRNTRDAKTIMLLSLISIVTPPLFLLVLIYYLFYYNKRKKLKSDQSLSSLFNRLEGKTKTELRSIRWNSSSLEQSVAASILENKKTLAVLIIIAIVLVLMISYIGMAYKMGWV